MKKRNQRILWGLAFMLLFAFALPAYGADEAPQISVKELNEIVVNPDLVILDVRSSKDWRNSNEKIAGAVRVNPEDIDSWAGNYSKEQKIVFYCA